MLIALSQSSDMKMSSKEIAKLTAKNHSHVLRDIRSMIEQLDNPKLDGIDSKRFLVVKRADNGQTSEIKLDHDLTLLLLTGYDVNARFKVIQRWKELELKELERKNIAHLTQEKRSAHSPMMNALIEHREEQGKKTMSHHFIIENKLCNWSVTGSFEAIDETQLTVDEMQLLTYARRTNESLIIAGLDYDERKRLLAYKVESKRRKIQKLLSN